VRNLQASVAEVQDARTEVQSLTAARSEIRQQLSDLERRHAELQVGRQIDPPATHITPRFKGDGWVSKTTPTACSPA